MWWEAYKWLFINFDFILFYALTGSKVSVQTESIFFFHSICKSSSSYQQFKKYINIVLNINLIYSQRCSEGMLFELLARCWKNQVQKSVHMAGVWEYECDCLQKHLTCNASKMTA